MNKIKCLVNKKTQESKWVKPEDIVIEVEGKQYTVLDLATRVLALEVENSTLKASNEKLKAVATLHTAQIKRLSLEVFGNENE